MLLTEFCITKALIIYNESNLIFSYSKEESIDNKLDISEENLSDIKLDCQDAAMWLLKCIDR